MPSAHCSRFLDEDFENLPDDMTGPENEKHRRRLAMQFIQRRRADIRSYMQADTPFPERGRGRRHLQTIT